MVFLVWRIPWTEEPGGLQSMGSQRIGCAEHTHTLQGQAVEVPICHFADITPQPFLFMLPDIFTNISEC